MPNTIAADQSEPFCAEVPVDVAQKVWDRHSGNPFNWRESQKWRIVLITSSVTLLVGLNATAITTPSQEIAKRFRVSDDRLPNSFWPVTVWNTGAAFGPMIGLPLLENFGVRNGYLVNGPLYFRMRAN